MITSIEDSYPGGAKMQPTSLLKRGSYSLDWIKDFYDQASIWWGPDPQVEGVHASRVDTIARLCGPGAKRILELGAGSGATSAALADAGHAVVSVELSPNRAQIARELAQIPRAGTLTLVEGDFYTVQLPGHFDVICCWETFGLGSDADQRRLLQRMACEWLSEQGCVLMDVYNPTRPARDADTVQRLPPLKGVPGSVEMNNRCTFDPVHCRWIDEWEPTGAPEKTLAQTIRCYTPADFLLLLEGSGLVLKRIEVDGEALDFQSSTITRSGPLLQAWSYLAQLILASR
jgi:SAM-dependent methyltransferase